MVLMLLKNNNPKLILNGNNMSDKLIDAEKDFEIKSLKNELKKLKNELMKYKILLRDLDDEANPDDISDVEVICVTELDKLKKTTKERELTSDEIKNLDVLHKNLKLARGESTRLGGNGKVKKLSDAELEAQAKNS